MKKWLMVLLVLAFAVPAGAEVLIFNWKEKIVEFEKESGNWALYKENIKGYVAGEQDAADANLVNLWFVETWKEKDPNGKMQKYVDTWPETFDLITAKVGKKEMAILSGADGEFRILLTGQIKPTKIGKEKWEIPKKLDGYLIWDEEDTDPPYDRDLGTAKESLRLHPKWTVEVNSNHLSAAASADWIVNFLKSKGYIEE